MHWQRNSSGFGVYNSRFNWDLFRIGNVIFHRNSCLILFPLPLVICHWNSCLLFNFVHFPLQVGLVIFHRNWRLPLLSWAFRLPRLWRIIWRSSRIPVGLEKGKREIELHPGRWKGKSIYIRGGKKEIQLGPGMEKRNLFTSGCYTLKFLVTICSGGSNFRIPQTEKWRRST